MSALLVKPTVTEVTELPDRRRRADAAGVLRDVNSDALWSDEALRKALLMMDAAVFCTATVQNAGALLA